MAEYSITIANNSTSPKTYVVFQAPAPGASALTGWSVRETITPGASGEVSFTPPPPKAPGLFEKLRALLFGAPPIAAPGQFRLAIDGDGPKAGPHIDFQASPTAPTTIVHGLDGGLSVAAVSTLGYSVFSTPVGNLAPTDQGDSFIAAYSIMAIFTNSAGSNCANGEYRQMVRGQFSVDGSVVSHILCGSTMMSPTVWQQDGCPPGTCTAYGYRACPPTAWSVYSNPDQATGSQYAMYDQPGFHNIQPGNTYSVDLQFQGQLVDTAVGATLATENWSVEGQLMAPTVELMDAPQGLRPTDRLVGVRLNRNLANDGPEVHVLIARVHGSPRLDPNAVKVALIDAEGRPVTAAEPVAHEVGGQRGTTATILHRLLPGQATPVKATLDIDGQVTETAITASPSRPVGNAMTTYTINVLNESGVSKSYIVFMQPPGSVTPIYTNAWATLENITDGGWDSVTYAPEGEDPPAPRVTIAEGAYTPGQIAKPSIGVNVATVDFAGLPQTTATVTEHPDGGYSVAYA